MALLEYTSGAGQAAGFFIEPASVKTSDWPANIIPAGAITFSQTSESGDCTVVGFCDPQTGEIHIQDVRGNA